MPASGPTLSGIDPAALMLPNCDALLGLLESQSKLENAFSQLGHQALNPCILTALKVLAKAFNQSAFDERAMIEDLKTRLVLSEISRHYKAFFGNNHPQTIAGLRSLFSSDGDVISSYGDLYFSETANEIVFEKSFNGLDEFGVYTPWSSSVTVLSIAAWSADGASEVLILFVDDSLGWHPYFKYQLFFLKADGPSGQIRVVKMSDWLWDHQHKVKRALDQQAQ